MHTSATCTGLAALIFELQFKSSESLKKLKKYFVKKKLGIVAKMSLFVKDTRQG